MDLTQIYDAIRSTCDKCQVPNLADRIAAEFNGRFTRCLGRAHFDQQAGTGKVLLSAPLWPRATDRQKYETVVHETVHIIVGYLYQNKRRRKPHGKEWRALMVHCGLAPEVCHNVDRTGLERRARKVDAYCACGVHPITRHLATRMRRGRKYICLCCRGRLALRKPKN